MQFKVEREIGAHVMSIETGKLAKLAHGSTLVRYGDTVVLGTAVTGPAREGIDFFPLTVDYREKMSAAGKFPGGFFKREGRPTNKEILTMRMIDRPLRPLFAKGFKDEVQVQIQVLSSDLENDPDVVGMVAASAAVQIAPLPFRGPVASVRVIQANGKFIVNPTRAQMEYAELELVCAGHLEGVNMIEIGAREASEQTVYDAIHFAHENGIVPICEMIAELQKHAGKEHSWEAPEEDTALYDKIRGDIYDDMVKAKSLDSKTERQETRSAVYDRIVEQYCPADVKEPEYDKKTIKGMVEKVEKSVVRERILHQGKRPDNRGPDDIRELTAEVGWLPRTHGSSLFSRGETQAMVTVTLGTTADEQLIDEMMEEYSKKFLLHYNFPPFSVGECRRIGPPGRREIGHGALAERAIVPMLPGPDDFPYTIRVVSDILESNGSSSMATTCGSSLALMDAGVPMKAAVAGISVGMVQEDDKYQLITDILGEEDHFGDMDFKVAGTRDGITGVQLDLKAYSLSFPILKEALDRALKARHEILDVMDATLDKPRGDISMFAPRVLTVMINPEKIGRLIGPGGKQIRAIEADTGAQLNIEDDGTVLIACVSAEGALAAKERVEAITEDIQIGKIYSGKIIGIKDFGAFVEIREGQDGLCHISELDDAYVKSVEDVVSMGQEVTVKVIAIDDQGRVKLSRKAAMKEGGGGKSDDEE